MYKERERESRTGRKKSEYEVGMDGRKYLKEKKECNKRIEEKEKGKEKKKKKKKKKRKKKKKKKKRLEDDGRILYTSIAT